MIASVAPGVPGVPRKEQPVGGRRIAAAGVAWVACTVRRDTVRDIPAYEVVVPIGARAANF